MPRRRSGRARAARRRRCCAGRAASRPTVSTGTSESRRGERAVRATAEVMSAPEVVELPAVAGRDEHLAGVRAADGGDRARDGVGLVEDRGVALERRRPARVSSIRSSSPSRRATTASPSRKSATSTDGSPSSRSASSRAVGADGAEPVDVPRAVRGGDERLVGVPEPVAEPRDVAHRRLAVVGHHDDGVSLEKRVEPAGRAHEPADRLVAAREHGRGRVGPGRVRGVVVVGEVEEEEVEPVARHEPPADGSGVGVDRAGRAVPEREGRAGPLALEEVVEEEPLRAEHGAEERDGRRGAACGRGRR